MNMAHFHIKKKKGRPYLYVREIARVAGKPRVVSQTYIGSPQKVAALAGGPWQEISRLKVEEFGALWLAHQLDTDMDIAKIVDSVIRRGERESGPSVGEYFLYCIFNRLVEAVSKNSLRRWYQHTAIQQIRPVNLQELSSQRYWEKWHHIDEGTLHRCSTLFFARLWEIAPPPADCLLFDTTNYYTFMASHTPSQLARRGKNKAGRHSLRQVGLGLLVARGSRLPLYYSVYPGNLHDSTHFASVMEEMFGIVRRFHSTTPSLTVVLDKGMNASENFAFLDAHPHLHFVTTYSPSFAPRLTALPLSRFAVVKTRKNQRLLAEGKAAECLLAYRTQGEYWGKERAVVVTYNPATARKQAITFQKKLLTLRRELWAMRRKVAQGAPHWRDPLAIQARYRRLCQKLHLPSRLFTLTISSGKSTLTMRYRKNSSHLRRRESLFGKHIIITDQKDWSTIEVVEASLDRWQVENRFRLSNDRDLVGVQPVRHWTDNMIRCHLFTCVVALTYLRRIELVLAAQGIERSAEEVMEDMRHLHSVLTLQKNARKPLRRLETPSKSQEEILRVFKHRVDESGVLQPIVD